MNIEVIEVDALPAYVRLQDAVLQDAVQFA